MTSATLGLAVLPVRAGEGNGASRWLCLEVYAVGMRAPWDRVWVQREPTRIHFACWSGLCLYASFPLPQATLWQLLVNFRVLPTSSNLTSAGLGESEMCVFALLSFGPAPSHLSSSLSCLHIHSSQCLSGTCCVLGVGRRGQRAIAALVGFRHPWKDTWAVLGREDIGGGE